MRLLNTKRLPQICFLATLAACSRPQANSNSATLASLEDDAQLSSVFATYQNVFKLPAYSQAVTILSNKSLTTVYSDAVAGATNASFNVGSHHFSGLKDFMTRLGPDATTAASAYGTQAKYWEHLGFNSSAQVSVSELNDGLSIYEQLVADASRGLTTDDAALLAKVQMVSLAFNMDKSSSALALEQTPAPVVSGDGAAGTVPPPIVINTRYSSSVTCNDRQHALVQNGVTVCVNGGTTSNYTAPASPPQSPPPPQPQGHGGH